MIERCLYVVCSRCGTRLLAGRGSGASTKSAERRAFAAGWRVVRAMRAGKTVSRHYCDECSGVVSEPEPEPEESCIPASPAFITTARGVN